MTNRPKHTISPQDLSRTSSETSTNKLGTCAHRKTGKKRKKRKIRTQEQKRPNTQSWQKNRHTITVFVRPVQREQEELDSEKIVLLVKAKRKKQLCECTGVAKQVLNTTEQQEKRESFGRSFSTAQCAERQREAELPQMLANLLQRPSPSPLTPGEWMRERESQNTQETRAGNATFGKVNSLLTVSALTFFHSHIIPEDNNAKTCVRTALLFTDPKKVLNQINQNVEQKTYKTRKNKGTKAI